MRKYLMSSAVLLCASLAFAQDDIKQPVQIKFSINVAHLTRTFGGLRREPTKLEAEIRNLHSTRRIKEVEFQFDVIDKMRRVVKERLFVTINDWGLGDRTIDVGKKRRWTAELGNTTFPEGCDSYGTLFSGTDCISEPKVNVVTFKDGTRWERTGWRDEPNPNKN